MLAFRFQLLASNDRHNIFLKAKNSHLKADLSRYGEAREFRHFRSFAEFLDG